MIRKQVLHFIFKFNFSIMNHLHALFTITADRMKNSQNWKNTLLDKQ